MDKEHAQHLAVEILSRYASDTPHVLTGSEGPNEAFQSMYEIIVAVLTEDSNKEPKSCQS